MIYILLFKWGLWVMLKVFVFIILVIEFEYFRFVLNIFGIFLNFDLINYCCYMIFFDYLYLLLNRGVILIVFFCFFFVL